MGSLRRPPPTRLATIAAAALYAYPILCIEVSERLLLLYLDKDCVLLRHKVHEGGSHHVEVPMNTIIRAASSIGASKVIMAHNHPTTSAEPSKADLEVTRRLHRVLHALDIELIDHLIFGGPRGAYTSFKHAGLL